jgi:hypothetical protein
MPHISMDVESARSEDTKPRTLTLNARLILDLDWLRSDGLQRNVLAILCLSLAALAFLVSLNAALRLKMHSEIPIWVASAIPPALSRVAYGHDRHYMSLNFVHDSFYGQLKGYEASHVNSVIGNILADNPVAVDRSDRILSGDDKGIVLVTELAFRLFGYKVQGVLYLYYLILGISAALFAYAYRRNPFALLLLAAFLLVHRMILPMIKYDGQLGAITALRCMPVLAMIACMHCLLFVFESKVDIRKLVLVVLQMAIIVFVIHIRSTTMWELALVIGASVVALLLRTGPVLTLPSRAFVRFARWPAAVPLVAGVVLMLGLNAHRAYGFPEEYHRGGEIVSRPFWHNIFSGFAYSPSLAKRYDLRIDDFTVLLATKQYLLENGREEVWEAAGGNTPGYTGMRWKVYDEAVKDMLFARCTEHFGECIAAFMYYKPLSMIKNLLWVCGLAALPPDMDLFVSKFPEIGVVVKDQFIDTTRQLDLRKERGRLWLRGFLTIAGAFALLAVVWRKRNEMLPIVAATAVLAAGSTAPSIIGYPAPHTIAEAALAIPLLLALLPAYALISRAKPTHAGDA